MLTSVISVEAAALIAQVYPVFILLLVLESSRVKQTKKLATLWSGILVLLRYLVVIAAVGGSVTSVCLSVIAVARNEPLDFWSSFITTVSGLLLFAAVLALLGDLIYGDFVRRLDDGEWSGINQRLKARRMARAVASPARHD